MTTATFRTRLFSKIDEALVHRIINALKNSCEITVPIFHIICEEHKSLT